MEIEICDYEFHCGTTSDAQGVSPIWGIIYGITKFARFLPVKFLYDACRLATIYIDKIARLDGVPVSIVLDRNSKMYLTSDKPLKAMRT